MQVTFINVGYGDAILFQASNGYTALLDGGSALPEEFAGNPHRVCGKDFLQARGIRHLNAVLISTSMKTMCADWKKFSTK